MIRDEVQDFVRLGRLPSEANNSQEDDEAFDEMERALHAIEKPVTDEEARLLLGCFGDDNCWGLAWTLLHLVESAPSLRSRPNRLRVPMPGSRDCGRAIGTV
ncbi:hypothetical protein [Streptomyces sp. NPDC086766]|uniref:hypothetical protein n=1 Tax=Streptomyces sp. NPDC086766 TaxID=3365754 RepID=UPI00382730EF